MTLEDAIAHAKKVAESSNCDECKQEHLQLVAWLEELNLRRNKLELFK